ncbi:hypothetical protein Tco_0951030 [Tanacetum coccineum]|uniref:Histone deacetylase 14 n=1 Tax=Tanacetum coccineum TaxID=301880 RepID=A0ABQ5DSY6_9ASTR
MINQCLTSKTSVHDRPIYPVLQILWGIITSSNVDFVELIWEEFVQAIQTFLTDKANLGSPTKKGSKDKPHVIPYFRFTKLIICYLERNHNIHQRSTSLFHLTEENLRHGNLKFVPKGEEDEVFGMPIPNELILNNIKNAPYYNTYLEMVTKHDQKVATEKEGKKKTTSAKQPKSKSATKKLSKPAPALKPKPAKEKPSKTSTTKPPKPKPAKATPRQKANKAQSEPEPEPKQEGEGEEYDMERAIQMSLESFQAQGHAHARGTYIDRTNSRGDIEILQIGDEQGDDVTEEVNLEDKIAEIDEDQAGSDPGETHKSRPLPEQVFMDEDQAGPDLGEGNVALARPDPEPAHKEFMADLYLKNLDNAYTIWDQFINDKAIEDEPEKLNVESEVVSMVTIPIYQASSLVPPMSTPIIDLPPPKPAPSTTQAPKFIAFEQKSKNLDNKTQNLGSRVFTLELRDLPHKIDEAVHENVKEAAQRDEFFAEQDKSRKRRHDDQDPPPPLPYSDLNKKK